MADTKHLIKLDGYWHFQRRIPHSKKFHRKSLKTKILKQAQASRDNILSRWDEIAAESETKAKVVGKIKEYNAVMAKSGRPYRYG